MTFADQVSPRNFKNGTDPTNVKISSNLSDFGNFLLLFLLNEQNFKNVIRGFFKLFINFPHVLRY